MGITAANIAKKYGRQQVLKDVGFSAKAGEIVGFTGRNGCGKTTLLSIIAGVEKADMGSVILHPERQTIGYLPQVNPLLEQVSVQDNLDLWCASRQDREHIISRFDLQEIRRKKVKHLSGGMKRRLALACAMAAAPSILIMDEPTAALDIEYKQLIHEEMERYVSGGGIILMVTHEKEEIEMCSKCYIIDNGIVLQST